MYIFLFFLVYRAWIIILCNLSFSDFKSTSEIDHIPWPSATGACGNWLAWFTIFPLLCLCVKVEILVLRTETYILFSLRWSVPNQWRRGIQEESALPLPMMFSCSQSETLEEKKRFSFPQEHWHVNIICIFSLQRCEKCLSCPKSFTGFNTIQ